MKSDKLDRRVQYTLMVLKQSLLELMADQPISRITVTEICERANINRGTFYVYYHDPYDLLAQIQNELDDDIQATLAKDMHSSRDVTVEILRSIAAQRSLCTVLFGKYGDAAFLQQLIYNARDQFVEDWRTNARRADADEVGRFYIFIANGIAATIQDWLQRDMAETPEEFASFIEKAISHGLSAFVTTQQAPKEQASNTRA